MLKNLKVGTKLVAILVAPVLVLVMLAVIGVRQRIDVANAASRVQDLTNLAQADSKVATELQKEGIYSAEYMATKRADGKADLDAQRAKSDQARAAFEDTAKGLSNDPAVQAAIKTAQGRLSSLPVNRLSVDNLQTDPPNVIDQYNNTSVAMTDLDSAIGRAIDDPDQSRGFQTFVNMQKLTSDRTLEAMLLTAVAEAKQFPATWGGATAAEITPCDPATVTTGACKIYKDMDTASTESARDQKNYEDNATPTQKQLLRDKDAANKFDELKDQAFKSAQSQKTTGLSFVGGDVVAASLAGVDSLSSAQTTLLQDVQLKAQTAQQQAQQQALLYILFAVGAIVIALVFAFLVARATTVPLKKLTGAAYALSTDKLPALVERLRNPDEEGMSLAETLTPIDISSKDEIGQLADAFNSIQQVTIEVAEEQAALLRKGIGDIFINLARRNQTLLDRQIEFIDQLEANEEDPDQLDNLFKLDHLATRMRRNAESLLVLAGAEPPRRRGRPVALADVVRVAIGEVEDFARIQLLALDDATVGGNVAVDLAHLLSELMENATHFSPPDTMVEIVGHRSDDGAYIISVSDQGIGMSAEQLGEANTQLSRPPLVGLALSRSLGFIVIGRLAQRFDINVKLTASPSGGVTALVSLPTDIVTYEGDETPSVGAGRGAIEEAPAVAEAEPAAEPEADTIVLHDDEVTVVDADEDADVVVAETDDHEADDEDADSLLDELVDETPIEIPQGDDFDRGLESVLSDEMPPGPVESDTPGTPPTEPATFPSSDDAGMAQAEAPEATPEVTEAQPAVVARAPGVTVAEQVTAAARAEAKVAELTAAGLVKRTPKKKSEESQWTSPNAEAAPVRSSGATHRSPEEVRKMLSRYRSGLNRGRGSADSEQDNS
jgi:signal transduction histidine kinase